MRQWVLCSCKRLSKYYFRHHSAFDSDGNSWTMFAGKAKPGSNGRTVLRAWVTT
jgi:hypothetical protein